MGTGHRAQGSAAAHVTVEYAARERMCACLVVVVVVETEAETEGKKTVCRQRKILRRRQSRNKGARQTGRQGLERNECGAGC